MTRPELPTKSAELHDLLQEMFGIGTYDDLTSDVPWWKARNLEIAKLNALMRKRGVTCEQLGKAAWHAKQQGIHVSNPIRLFPLITEAIVAWRQADVAEARERASALLTEVVEEAYEAGETQWVDRLLRADPDNAAALITQWRSR